MILVFSSTDYPLSLVMVGWLSVAIIGFLDRLTIFVEHCQSPQRADGIPNGIHLNKLLFHPLHQQQIYLNSVGTSEMVTWVITLPRTVSYE